MTSTPGNASSDLPGKPAVVDLATWRAAREELLVREKAHTREGDCWLRDGDRVFLTYSTTGRGNEPVDATLGLLDMTPSGRREAWEDNPEGWPGPARVGSPVGGHGAQICWYWRSDADGNASRCPTSRPVAQWTRPGATPEETLGRQGDHH